MIPFTVIIIIAAFIVIAAILSSGLFIRWLDKKLKKNDGDAEL
ncbi:MAG: hypothetical protein V1720_14465 [bacterium]